jgi:hypothetical protein
MKVTFKLVLISLLLFLSCISGLVAQTSFEITIYYNNLSSIKQDGIINNNEYPVKYIIHSHQDQHFVDLYIVHNNTHLAIALSGKFKGFVGIGFNEFGKGMLNSDMIIASVNNNNISIANYDGVGYNVPIIHEEQLESLKNSAGKFVDEKTTVEFMIPMSLNPFSIHELLIDERFAIFIAAHESSKELMYHTWRTPILTAILADDSRSAFNSISTIGKSIFQTIVLLKIIILIIIKRFFINHK